MRKKSCSFDKYVRLGGPSNLNISPKLPQIFGDILGNHGEILHVAWKPVGSKGLNHIFLYDCLGSG